jgi:CRP-like cAMP-binding protein
MISSATRDVRRSDEDIRTVILRLQEGWPCSPELVARVEALGTRVETLPAKSTLQTQGEPLRRPRYLISGWACRYRHLSDGRRQIFDVVLPGEGISVCLRANPLANTSLMALTPVKLVDAGPLLQPGTYEACTELVAALHAQADADERRALDQIVRLGRLTALERLADLFLDLHARLKVIGHAQGDRFPIPLTQETLADMTGLSVVHVNRTLQELRRQSLVRIERGWAHLLNPSTLACIADRDV